MSLDHPETLVKYCTANTAKMILSTQSLRWSAPHLFSDPFESNHDTQLPFDPHDLLDASIKAAIALIFAKNAPNGQSPMVAAIRRWRDEERFTSPEEAEEVLKELLSQIVDQRQAAIDQIMMDWRKFTRTLRICCFSSKPDNIAAWRQYAQQHQGVAIRFQCGDSTVLSKPQQIDYKGGRTEITTLKEQLDIMINNEQFVPQDHFYEKFTNKSSVDSPLQEWRCFHQTPKTTTNNSNPQANDSFNDIEFQPSEIVAVYFGIYTNAKIKRALYDLIKEQYSQAKVFQAKTTTSKYEVEFDQIIARK